MTTVLVIDDEPSICWGFQNLLQPLGMNVLIAGTTAEGLCIAQQNSIDLVLLDVRLPDGSGLDLIEPLLQATDDAPVVLMTAYGDLETAVKAIDRGAVDYLHKPFRLSEALAMCQKAIGRKSQSLPEGGGVRDDDATTAPNRLIGTSPAMQKLFHQIALVADSNLTVLIVGETGTGKELVAAAIHRHSSRRDRPYLAVAPVTFNPTLLESELFGYVRGAFTGAVEDRVGVFGSANGGTIFLDEIGDLPLSAQVKLLRVLEQKSYSRVGETQSHSCDVRILAATNTDLKKAVAEGRFREDLLYRLSGMVLEIPPLRERTEDMEPLAKYFLSQAGYSNPEQNLSPTVIAMLKARSWPGNVRELRNAVARAAVIARRRALDVTDFFADDPALQPGNLSSVAAAIKTWVGQELNRPHDQELPDSSKSRPPMLERFLSVAEPIVLRSVLEHVNGNRSLAAELLGIHRSTLRERLLRYGIE